MSQNFIQPTIPQDQAHAFDIHNSLHSSRFAFYLSQTVVVGLQHPDDKRKTATAYQRDQMDVLVQELRARTMQLEHKFYPGLTKIPKQTSLEFKRESSVLKDQFEAKKKLIERFTKVLHEMVDLSEEFAFLCEIPGWNNTTYLQNVHISRQAEPYYQPPNIQLPAPVAHAHLARRKAFIEDVASEAPVSQQLTLTNQMASMNVDSASMNVDYMNDYWVTGKILDQSKRLSSPLQLQLSVPKIPTNLSASAESDESSVSDESSESEQEEQDEWMSVYRHCFFPEVGGQIAGIYFETFGGGPQGGFVETSDSVFKVSREWFQTWKVKRLPSGIFLQLRQCPDAGDAFAPECRLNRRRCEASANE
jgi:hypothetical protein